MGCPGRMKAAMIWIAYLTDMLKPTQVMVISWFEVRDQVRHTCSRSDCTKFEKLCTLDKMVCSLNPRTTAKEQLSTVVKKYQNNYICRMVLENSTGEKDDTPSRHENSPMRSCIATSDTDS